MRRIIFETIGVLLAVAGLITSSWSLFSNGSAPDLVLAIALSAVALAGLSVAYISLIDLHRLRLDGDRAGRWADAMPKISQAVLHLADSVTETPADKDSDNTPFQRHAGKACNALSSAFTQVVGRDCRVTLKETFLPVSPAGDPTSDETAVKEIYTTGVPGPTPQGIDWVSDNTDFDEIFSGENYFLCNDLPAEVGKGYRNSHWTRARIKEMNEKGTFPYRSTIVWPIRARLGSDTGSWNLVGFLCVDCKEANAFDATLDPSYGEVIARALYSVWPRTPVDWHDRPVTEEV